MPLIDIIEDDDIMAECIMRACQKVASEARVRIFGDAVTAVAELDESPDLIFLDVLLTGPDGFTYLNELASYPETAKIPVVIVSSLDFRGKDLSAYGVVGMLDKATMRPEDIQKYVRRYVLSREKAKEASKDA